LPITLGRRNRCFGKSWMDGPNVDGDDILTDDIAWTAHRWSIEVD